MRTIFFRRLSLRGWRGIICLAIGGLLAISSQALAANMPGDSCNQLGETSLSADHAEILACLLKTPDPKATDCSNGCIFKAEQGGGGITGGCDISGSTGGTNGIMKYGLKSQWGQGCTGAGYFTQTAVGVCNSYTSPGYVCWISGAVPSEINSGFAEKSNGYYAYDASCVCERLN